MVSKPDERDPDGRTDRLSAFPSVADRYRDHALSLSPPVGTPARESAIPISKPERQGKKGQSHESVFYDSAPSERSPAKGILKIFGQPSRLSRDCQRQPPEKLRFRRSRNTQDYCLGAFGTINGTKASARISPCGARSGSSQRDTVIFIRYFPGFTPSSGTRTVAVSRGGMSAEQIPSATTR